jgi:hypothetical protein
MAAEAKPESRLLQYLRTAPEDSIFGILGLDEQRRKKQAAEAKKRAETAERTRRHEEAARAAAAAAAEAERRKAERHRLALQRFVHGTQSKTLQLWVGLSGYKRHLRLNAAKIIALRARRELLDAWEGWYGRHIHDKERAAAEAVAAAAASAAADSANLTHARWLKNLSDEVEVTPHA